MSFAFYERSSAWAPRVDVSEDAERFMLQADLPGVESKDIQITADEGLLTISGERHIAQRDTRNGRERLERADGQFLRRFTLPENVRSDDIKARHANGVLEIVIPKQPVPQPRRIAIQAN
jgi:HSP20 family protein